MILYVINQYPCLSETFIAREIDGLKAYGLDIKVAALRGPIKRDSDSPPAIYAPPMLGIGWLTSQLYFALRAPRLYTSLLCRAALRESRSPTGILKNIRRFFQAVAIARSMINSKPARIHAQFAHVAADAAQVISTLLARPYSVSVHAWDIYTQSTGRLVHRLAGADFIVTCTQRGAEYLSGKLKEDNCRLSVVLAKEITADSETTASIPIHVINHGLPTGLFNNEKPCPAPRPPWIVAVGRLTAKKGFADLIRACSCLAKQQIEFQCLIAGEGEERPRLEGLIQDHGLESCVSLAGAKSALEIRDLLQEARLFVLPSVITEDDDRDGLPNAILEAMASGIPVITTTASAAMEAIEDARTGLLVPPGAPDKLAAAMARLIEAPEEARKIGRAGRRIVSAKFDLARTIPPLAALLETIPPENI